jgi:IS5 family transposase
VEDTSLERDCDVRVQSCSKTDDHSGIDTWRRRASRSTRNHPLSDAQANANRDRSKIRARVEHVFGAQETAPGGRIVRTIGTVRACAKIEKFFREASLFPG